MLAPLREAHHRGEYVLGTPFLVRTYDRGTRAEMKRQAENFRDNLLKYLDYHYELGCFACSKEWRDDGLGGYDVFVAYWGEASDPQRKGKWKKQRRLQNPTKRPS